MAKPKPKKNLSVSALRKILGKTQSEFAGCIGVSVHSIVSIENGRNPLTPKLAQRIRVFCGVDADSLIQGEGRLLDSIGNPYNQNVFDYWKSRFAESSDNAAENNFQLSQDALHILYKAATRPGIGKVRNRLPAIYQSFIDWANQARIDFKLEKQIDDVLKDRSCKDTVTMTYKDWRNDLRGADFFASQWNFSDDPKKDESTKLSLTITTHPGWTGPWGSMKGHGPARNREFNF